MKLVLDTTHFLVQQLSLHARCVVVIQSLLRGLGRLYMQIRLTCHKQLLLHQKSHRLAFLPLVGAAMVTKPSLLDQFVRLGRTTGAIFVQNWFRLFSFDLMQ